MVIRKYMSLKVKVSTIYDQYVGEVPVRDDTCPGPLALRGSLASSFPRPQFSPQCFPQALIRCWVDSDRSPTLGSRCVSNHGSSAQ